jgi:two-component system C4-dicarboxylate transport response regulator DctD
MSGLDVLNAILRQDSNNLVIIITAYGTSEAIIELMNHGAVDVLPKPFFPSDILKTIAAALKSREAKPQMRVDKIGRKKGEEGKR